MKSIRFSLINKKFDDQYTFDLQGYLSVQDFCTTFRLLNETVKRSPPPGNKLLWFIFVWILWIIAIVSNYVMWVFTQSSQGLIVLPFVMVLITLLCVWRHRVLRQKFEYNILSICNSINATENIRGINYRFSKNGSDLCDVGKQVRVASNATFKTAYAIVVEFDDRYNALASQQFNRYPSIDFVTVPLCAHINSPAAAVTAATTTTTTTTATSKDEKSSYPSWSNNTKYDEKFIIQYR